jgi:hypothetical protein
LAKDDKVIVELERRAGLRHRRALADAGLQALPEVGARTIVRRPTNKMTEAHRQQIAQEMGGEALTARSAPASSASR